MSDPASLGRGRLERKCRARRSIRIAKSRSCAVKLTLERGNCDGLSLTSAGRSLWASIRPRLTGTGRSGARASQPLASSYRVRTGHALHGLYTDASWRAEVSMCRMQRECHLRRLRLREPDQEHAGRRPRARRDATMASRDFHFQHSSSISSPRVLRLILHFCC